MSTVTSFSPTYSPPSTTIVPAATATAPVTNDGALAKSDSGSSATTATKSSTVSNSARTGPSIGSNEWVRVSFNRQQYLDWLRGATTYQEAAKSAATAKDTSSDKAAQPAETTTRETVKAVAVGSDEWVRKSFNRQQYLEWLMGMTKPTATATTETAALKAEQPAPITTDPVAEPTTETAPADDSNAETTSPSETEAPPSTGAAGAPAQPVEEPEAAPISEPAIPAPTQPAPDPAPSTGGGGLFGWLLGR